MALAACWAVAAGPAAATPRGYRTTELAGIGSGISAVAYAPDGTLYVAEMGSSDLTVIAPDGARSSLPLVGAALVGPSGMWVGPAGTTVYVADNKNFADGAGDLYAVRVADGQAETVLSGIDFIDDVAVRSTGEIFIADAAGMGFGAVYQAVYDNVGGSYSAVPVVTGLDFVAGLAFDPAGNLIYQQAATFDFIGEVYRLPIIDGGGPLAFGSPELLATGLSAAMDLAVDGEADVFVSGGGGVFQLDRDAGGAFTGTASAFRNHGFSTEIAFGAGAVPFEPFAGWHDGGHLTYVPSYGADALADVTTVPEPTVAALTTLGGLAILRRRMRGRTR